MYPKVIGEKAWLIQLIHCDGQLCKALFVGVKESVTAVTARMIRGDRLDCEHGEQFQPTPGKAIRTSCKTISSSPYVIGGVHHPDLLAELVCGRTAQDFHQQAAPLFKNMGVPILGAWIPLLWDLAIQEGYATQLDTFGVDELVWRLRLPSPESFMIHMENHLNELFLLAEQALA